MFEMFQYSFILPGSVFIFSRYEAYKYETYLTVESFIRKCPNITLETQYYSLNHRLLHIYNSQSLDQSWESHWLLFGFTYLAVQVGERRGC